jgi:hypothetical protein
MSRFTINLPIIAIFGYINSPIYLINKYYLYLENKSNCARRYFKNA